MPKVVVAAAVAILLLLLLLLLLHHHPATTSQTDSRAATNNDDYILRFLPRFLRLRQPRRRTILSTQQPAPALLPLHSDSTNQPPTLKRKNFPVYDVWALASLTQRLYISARDREHSAPFPRRIGGLTIWLLVIGFWFLAIDFCLHIYPLRVAYVAA